MTPASLAAATLLIAGFALYARGLLLWELHTWAIGVVMLLAGAGLTEALVWMRIAGMGL